MKNDPDNALTDQESPKNTPQIRILISIKVILVSNLEALFFKQKLKQTEETNG